MSDTIKIYYPNSIEDNSLENIINGSGEETPTNDNASSPDSIPGTNIPSYTVASEVVSVSLDTLQRRIIASFGFAETGAIQVGRYVNGSTGDIRISPNGIVGRDKNGATTFAIDGTTGDATFRGTIVAGSVVAGYVADVGGNYSSSATAAAAKVKIFPDANTGIVAYASDGTSVVFKVAVGGTSVGDVTIGDYSGGHGMLWDQSANRLYIKGDVTAGNIDAARISSGTLDVSRIPNLSADIITSGTINATNIAVTNLTATNINQGTLYVGGTGKVSQIVISQNTEGNAYLRFGSSSGSRIWVDSSGYMGLNALGGRVYVYADSEEVAIFQSGTNQSIFKKGISCQGALNVSDGNDTRFGEGANVYFRSNHEQYMNADDNDLRIHAAENIEFYKGSSIKGIFDTNFWANGDIDCNGTKNFLIPHPDGSDRLLRYTVQESPEVLLRVRGKDTIVHGRCKLDLPRHFILVTEPTGLVTVNLTATKKNQDLYVEHIVGNSDIVISGDDGDFMFEVIAIRKGYLDYAVELGAGGENENDARVFSRHQHVKEVNRKAAKMLDKGNK